MVALKIWKENYYQAAARELSAFTKYFSRVIAWHPLEHDSQAIFSKLLSPAKVIVDAKANFPEVDNGADLFLLNGHFNYSLDIQALLDELKTKMRRNSRVAVIAYNPYFRWLYVWAKKRGWLSGPIPCTFLTRSSLDSLSTLSGFSIVKTRSVMALPFAVPYLSAFLNRLIPAIPLLRNFALAEIIVLRPILPSESLSLSIVIPARNEAGNVPFFLSRLPDFGDDPVEVLIVEGNSTDDTWAAIQRLVTSHQTKFKVRALQQTGKGKNDAVRLGFREAKGDLLTILDADLTMPPELLKRYHDAYKRGLADFINGSRLVYPMEGEAMRFLNFLGNTFFSKALSYVLSLSLSDTLCGTKLVSKEDYLRIRKWSEDFGDFDPFGDFELLFGASVLGLGTIDLPVYYRARTYGETNIRRFYHGLMLLKMCWIGFIRLRLGK